MAIPACILLVDDNPDDRALARRALRSRFPEAGFIEVGTAADFIRHLDAAFDCVITDYRLGWSDGLKVLAEVKRRSPDLPVIMFTNTGSEEVCAAGMREGLSDYIVKRREEFPKLPAAVSTALDLAQARRMVKERDKELQELLERERFARAEAVRASNLKDEFLATVSHELRTPLSAILGWTHILQLGRITREQEQEAFKIIERNARMQVKLIEDLLDMSRILSGTLRIELGPLDLLDAMNTVIGEFQPLAAKKSITLDTQFDPAPLPIRGDAQRVQQIVTNLLANALKFTPEGGRVVVSLKHVGSDMQIVVSDNGAGINPEFAPHLFDRFRQSDAGPTRRHGGLGIGLSVVKNLVELHNGTVAAYSAGPGKGARFVVSFPVAVMREQQVTLTEALARKEMSYEKLKGLEILVIDDDPDTLTIIQRVLSLYGASVSTASSAAQGLDLLSSQPFDILLSDIGMADVDGFTLIEQLRSTGGRGGLNQRIPAASVTAFSRSQDRERALLSGFDAHLVKPIEPGELIAVILSLAKRAGQKAAPEDPASA